MRCVSASARRKKCILGFPKRPCFSKSAPCGQIAGLRNGVCCTFEAELITLNQRHPGPFLQAGQRASQWAVACKPHP